jgi:hypothetical protein
MTQMTDELLARIAERAADPNRRYMTAAEDQSRVELPVDEIEGRFEEWHARNEERAREAALRDGMTPEEYEENVRLNKALQGQSGNSQSFALGLIQAQMRAWGQSPPSKMSFVETDGHIGASTQPPGAKPLGSPPSEADWMELERIVGRPMPDDLKRLYSIADGGFGPGFAGLNPLHLIGSFHEDFRRRGPDYCGTIEYPASFLPIAGETLDYHYDLDTGRIISSNQDWDNDGLEPEDIYDIAHQNLADMMEDWLERS